MKTLADLTPEERERIVAGFKFARKGIPTWIYTRNEVIKATAKMLEVDEDTVRQVLIEEGE